MAPNSKLTGNNIGAWATFSLFMLLIQKGPLPRQKYMQHLLRFIWILLELFQKSLFWPNLDLQYRGKNGEKEKIILSHGLDFFNSSLH